ncbi:MAG: hypothetical protein P8O03_15020 [Ilumatobacter sp.]|nr:hypothetical protein [Ilumatobacter sp.]
MSCDVGRLADNRTAVSRNGYHRRAAGTTTIIGPTPDAVIRLACGQMITERSSTHPPSCPSRRCSLISLGAGFGPTYFSQAAYAEYNDPDPVIEHGRHGADGLAAAHTADI